MLPLAALGVKRKPSVSQRQPMKNEPQYLVNLITGH